MLGVPGKRAASTQPLILYVASENILGPLEEHGERHARDVALLRGGHLVAKGKLQQRLKTHLRKLFSHPHIDLCLCQEKTIYLLDYFADAALQRFAVSGRTALLSCSTHESLMGAIVGDESQRGLLQQIKDLFDSFTWPPYRAINVRNMSEQYSFSRIILAAKVTSYL